MGTADRHGADGRGVATEPKYNHHRLDVHEAALEFLRWRRDHLRKVARGSTLGDQIDRASTASRPC